jgi:hypothetical protein
MILQRPRSGIESGLPVIALKNSESGGVCHHGRSKSTSFRFPGYPNQSQVCQMDAFSRTHEIAAVFADPWAYPGLLVRPATSWRLTFEERHHLVWSSWTIFDEGTHCYARRIEWPCAMGARSQTAGFTRTFAAESGVDRRLAEDLVAEAISAASVGLPMAANATAIDGAERSLRFWHAGAQKTLNWASAHDSSLDLWFLRAAALLDARLPESHAHAYYKIRRDEIASKEAANPRDA